MHNFLKQIAIQLLTILNTLQKVIYPTYPHKAVFLHRKHPSYPPVSRILYKIFFLGPVYGIFAKYPNLFKDLETTLMDIVNLNMFFFACLESRGKSTTIPGADAFYLPVLYIGRIVYGTDLLMKDV